MPIKAFFSILQFIPDRMRNERINVAVVLQSPSYGFAGMEFRRRMDGILKEICPTVDAQLVRLLVQGIAEEFKPFYIEPERARLFFLHPKTQHPSHPDYLQKFHEPHGLIHFSDPKPIIIPDSQSLVYKVKQLRNQLLEVERPLEVRTSITKRELQEKVVESLRQKRVALNVKPDEFIGARWSNKFDALHEKTNRRHLQFLSFDLEEVPTIHAKAFVTSVQDLKAGGRAYQDDQFGCVLQPPTYHRDHRDEFEAAIKIFRTSDIVVYNNYAEDINRLAENLQSDNGLTAV
jgi:hypothetical protein